MNTLFNLPRLHLFSIFTVALLFSASLKGQEKNDSIPTYTKEWKLNSFNLLVFQALEISYEKYIDPETSYGFTGLISLAGKDRFNDTAPFYYEDIALSSFYRIYFGKGSNKGFFIEAFGSLSVGEYDNYVDYDYYPVDYDYSRTDYSYNQSFTEFGLGFAIGGKFITKEKYSLSVIGGLARNLLSDKGPGAMPRVGITVGKRF